MSTLIKIDPLYASVTPVKTWSGDSQLATATAFFWSANDKLFLITNRHVVQNAQGNYRPDTIEFRVHLSDTDLRRSQWVKCKLTEQSRDLWLQFPDRSIDIAAVELDKRTLEHCQYSPFSSKNLLPPDVLLDVGADLLVIGYPMGFYDEMLNLPIVRNASLASAYPVPFNGRQHFVIDARLHPGTSGSPIITKPSLSIRTRGDVQMFDSPVWFFLGIHSHTWPVEPGQEPLGLNAVWFGQLVQQLTEQ